jgi:hypothetical protein
MHPAPSLQLRVIYSPTLSVGKILEESRVAFAFPGIFATHTFLKSSFIESYLDEALCFQEL